MSTALLNWPYCNLHCHCILLIQKILYSSVLVTWHFPLIHHIYDHQWGKVMVVKKKTIKHINRDIKKNMLLIGFNPTFFFFFYRCKLYTNPMKCNIYWHLYIFNPQSLPVYSAVIYDCRLNVVLGLKSLRTTCWKTLLNSFRLTIT